MLFLILVAALSPETLKWNAPVAPFRIAGNVYYVGAAEVSSFLIATPQGLIVLDGGFEETAPMIEANIRKLGFDPKQVRILLASHPHYDHAGGLKQLRDDTGARFYASKGDAPLFARGGLGDPQFGDRFPFPALEPDVLLKDGDTVTLGGTTLVAHVTAGHTPGCTTWTMTVRDGGKAYDVVFVGSPSVPSEYRLTGNARYPNAVDDYRRQFAVLESLPCDIFLASHGSMFHLQEKLAKGSFVDPEGYRQFVARMKAAFEARVKQEWTKTSSR